MQIEYAPAKINLTLHVVGQRQDGYHDLDSLVVFADVGDVLYAELADEYRLDVIGPKAHELSGGDENLVLRAARLIGVPSYLKLEKNLPLASGIGGGSADAAAALRLLARLSGRSLPDVSGLIKLGADVPACLYSRPLRMGGIGGSISLLAQIPEFWVVLVNPGILLSTPSVFEALAQRANPPMPHALPLMGTVHEFVAFLSDHRNDLEAPAMTLSPIIADVKAALIAQAGCLLARMSGSGATCFGLFQTADLADRAARALGAAQPEWWVAHAAVRAP